MPTVFLSSPTNSQLFTTCCEVAICDYQDRCPVCEQVIHPESARDRQWAAYGPIKAGSRRYGNHSPNDRTDSAWSRYTGRPASERHPARAASADLGGQF